MQQALPPHDQSRNDFDIYRDLSALAGHEAAFTEGRNEAGWIQHIYDRMAMQWTKAGLDVPDFDAFWRKGYLELPEPADDFVLFQDFRADPRAHSLKTPSGKIELYSERIAGFGYADCPPHPSLAGTVEWLGAEAASIWPLHLVTSQPADKLHSQMDAGSLSMGAKIKARERVQLDPQDAAQRGIGASDIVRVFNDRGSCIAAAVLNDDVMPGVAVMSTGAWFDPQSSSLERHGNPNVLTIDIGTSALTQAPSAQSALVQVAKWEGEVPAVMVFELPAIAAMKSQQHIIL